MSDNNPNLININSKNIGNYVGIAILGVLTWWISTIQENIEISKKTNIQVERNTRDIVEVQRWQKEWPTNGELSVDIKQNKDIEYVKRSINAIERKLEQLKQNLDIINMKERTR